jgi:hypothetical protein
MDIGFRAQLISLMQEQIQKTMFIETCVAISTGCQIQTRRSHKPKTLCCLKVYTVKKIEVELCVLPQKHAPGINKPLPVANPAADIGHRNSVRYCTLTEREVLNEVMLNYCFRVLSDSVSK